MGRGRSRARAVSRKEKLENRGWIKPALILAAARGATGTALGVPPGKAKLENAGAGNKAPGNTRGSRTAASGGNVEFSNEGAGDVAGGKGGPGAAWASWPWAPTWVPPPLDPDGFGGAESPGAGGGGGEEVSPLGGRG